MERGASKIAHLPTVLLVLLLLTSEFVHRAATGTPDPPGLLVKGDLNLDGVANLADIGPFILAVHDPQAWQTEYGSSLEVLLAIADFDGDGKVTLDDRTAFCDAIAAAGGPGAGSGSGSAGALAGGFGMILAG